MPLETGAKRTIKEVARQAGLSVGTVSSVLNGSQQFAETTRKRVWDAAHALNYSPNRQARTLRAGGPGEGRARTGIVMHVSHLGGDNPMENPLDAPRSLLLAWLAQQRGLYPISYWYHRRQGFQCPPVLNGAVDGAIVGTPHLEVVEILREKLPLVLLDVPFAAATAELPLVNADRRAGFAPLAAQLASQGHRRLGIVHSNHRGDGADTEAPNLAAIREAARDSGLEIPEGCCLADDLVPETHQRLMQQLTDAFVPLIRSRRVTAILAPGESYAITLCENLRQRGIRIPEDVSLAMPYSGMDAPPHAIACTALDWPAMLALALDVLVALIAGKPSPCREYLVAPRVLPGNTIGPAPTLSPQ